MQVQKYMHTIESLHSIHNV